MKNVPAAAILNLLNSRPAHNECHAVYASRMVTTLTTKWCNMTAEKIAVSTVLGHMANFDSRLQRVAFSSDASSRHQLQMELKAFTFEKNGQTEGTGGDHKRAKIICHACKQPGHKMANCRLKRSDVEVKQQQQQDLRNVTCYRCGQLGHLANRCNRCPGDGSLYQSAFLEGLLWLHATKVSMQFNASCTSPRASCHDLLIYPLYRYALYAMGHLLLRLDVTLLVSSQMTPFQFFTLYNCRQNFERTYSFWQANNIDKSRVLFQPKCITDL
ncbi:uncharacterized protein LOC120446741 [Drosophila santomea]|uniref:uncharacterized protein LOC120446740 n=1 Tax=Drosophila santomea TaxID=129105 RepID=UPI001953B828|nr:uncharacterized protein LOC120446740 [Drosophila santomea]XP_039483799.1 uncharacterized protein LOC120446741 [Drosophila santomea]